MIPTQIQTEGGEPVSIGQAPHFAVGWHVVHPDSEGGPQRWQVTEIDWYRDDVGSWIQLLSVTAEDGSAAVPGSLS